MDILSVASVTLVGPGGLGDLACEVTVSVVGSTGHVVKVCETVPVLGVQDFVLTILWLIAAGQMGYGVSGLATGITGDVASGLVPGLSG